MAHQTGRFDSWNVVNELNVEKECDKSFFVNNGSGIPAEIRWFFDAEEMTPGQNKNIALRFGDNIYDARINKESHELGRTRIFWSANFSKAFAAKKKKPADKLIARFENGYEGLTVEPYLTEVSLFNSKQITELLNSFSIKNHIVEPNMIAFGDDNSKSRMIHLQDNRRFVLYITYEDYKTLVESEVLKKNIVKLNDNVSGASERQMEEQARLNPDLIFCVADEENGSEYRPHNIYIYSDDSLKAVINFIRSELQKKISVNDAIWIATAVIAYEKYHVEGTRSIAGYAFSQADIIRRASEYTDDNVDAARASQWCCGDHDNHSHAYLRAVDSKRRLSFHNEFAGEASEPSGLDMSKTIQTSAGDVSLQQLFDFVHKEYSDMADQVIQKTDIDYNAPLEYIDLHAKEAYSGPDKITTEEEKVRISALRVSAQNAVAQMNKVIELCDKSFKLKRAAQVKWLDGSNTKTKHYLWGQMKYADRLDNPISISIFVDKNAETLQPRYRISLETMNKDSDLAMMKKYHSYLDMDPDITHELSYGAGSNEAGYVEIIDDDLDTIKEKIEDGTYKKVQYCKVINQNSDYSNEDYERLILEGVEALIPYYEHVTSGENEQYWPSKEEYDPGITTEQWIDLLRDSTVVSENNLQMLSMMLAYGKPATCTQFAERFGKTKNFFNAGSASLAKKVADKTGCPLPPERINENAKWWPILYVGRYAAENEKGSYVWKLREELKNALTQIEIPEIEGENNMNSEEKNFSLNTILYGPPGTGKTYNTVKYAVAICEEQPLSNYDDMDYSEILEKYEWFKTQGRIAFTTFHQSYGYEEFIEGIKPVLSATEEADDSKEIKYDVVPGLFKKFCKNASTKWVSVGNTIFSMNEKIWKVTVRSNVKKDCFDNDYVRVDYNIDDINAAGFVNDIEVGDIIITTDGSRSTINGIAKVVGEEAYMLKTESDKLTRDVKWIAKDIDENIVGINSDKILHRMTVARVPHMKVEDLVSVVENVNLYDLDEVEAEEEVKGPYVFIIDEINRGNISKIFGELITLIEDTKRAGADEAMEAILPYSNEPFSVPNNVYILGTMNTADRSIALMDTALRRRFQFEEMMPNAQVLRDIGADKVEDLDVAAMLEKINERISFLYDREHTIGHAFFTGLKDDPTVEKLASIFQRSVIPLLQEYFYEDYQKIQFVLGDNAKSEDKYKFIQDVTVVAKNIFKGSVDDVIDLPEKKYVINTEAFMELQSYKEIM
ncbi:AAA family ATPase [Butyrivibrio sp. FC2001]|uniref:AAA family ATPase n=1 Tax=Butyrivibrio sp. FC2001 TaxID=1280671 RepID=UPI000424FD08|nr:AAA family ATPase [Butyrivibrio sp. FC2001]